MTFTLSPNAARELHLAIEDGYSVVDDEMEELSGATDCPDGCKVEPDGECHHGFLSAGRTLQIF